MKPTQVTEAAARAARRFGWGHNELRRPTDRVETAAVVTAIALAAASVPVALLTGSIVHQRNLSTAAAQQAARHQVTAILLDATVGEIPTNARWLGLDGSRHTGLVAAPGSAGAGAPVRIWTDAHGNVTDPPLDAAQAWSRGALSFVTTVAVTGGVLATAVGLLRRRLDHIRYAAWDAEWITATSHR